MTNKVKPFYIRITDDMTPQMVQDAFDKCVDAGAVAKESITHTDKKHRYVRDYDMHFNYFGVDDDNITALYDIHENYGDDTQEITLDQLDEWLGLESKTEWDGEGLPPVGVECEWIGGGLNHGDWGLVVVRAYNGDCAWIEKLNNNSMHTVMNPAHFRKPETPEQKAERELYEAIEDGYNLAPDGLDIPINKYVAKLLYQQGYRKQ